MKEYIGEVYVGNEKQLCHMVQVRETEKDHLIPLQVIPMKNIRDHHPMVFLLLSNDKKVAKYGAGKTNQIPHKRCGFVDRKYLYECLVKQQRITPIEVIGHGFRISSMLVHKGLKHEQVTESFLFLRIGSHFLQLCIPNGVWDLYEKSYERAFLYYEWKDSIFEFDTSFCSESVIHDPETISKIILFDIALKLDSYQILFCPNYNSEEIGSGLVLPKQSIYRTNML